MTALRIHRCDRPSMVGQPVQPMSRADAEFWALRSGQTPQPGMFRRLFGRG